MLTAGRDGMSLEGIPPENGDLYANVFYDSVNNSRHLVLHGAAQGSFNAYQRALCALLLRAGLLLVQLGSIPVRDTTLILLHNLSEMSLGTVCYVLVGYMLSYGTDVAGLLGYGVWIGSDRAVMEDAVAGWAAVVSATGLLTTAVSGRLHVVGLCALVLLMASLLGPLLIHWIWTPMGFMHDYTFAGFHVSYTDAGGCVVVHILAGVISLLTLLFMGRRLLRLKDLHESSLAQSSPATCFLGHFLVALGLMALCMPGQQEARTLMSCLLAWAGGCLVVCLLQAIIWEPVRYWSAGLCMQGGSAALVFLSAGASEYTPAISLLLGLIGGALFCLLSKAVFRSPLEDYCNVVSAHLGCGLAGSLLPPLFLLAFSTDMAMHLCWHAICDLAVLVGTATLTTLLLLLLKLLGFIYTPDGELDHRRALTVLDRGPHRSVLQRIVPLAHPPHLLLPGNMPKDEEYQRGTLHS